MEKVFVPKVVKDKSLPELKPRPSRRIIWPIAHMNIGDAFLVPDNLGKNVRLTAYQTAKRAGVKVSVRQQEGNLLRVTRVA